jgi:hypothetical protein
LGFQGRMRDRNSLPLESIRVDSDVALVAQKKRKFARGWWCCMRGKIKGSGAVL